MPLRIAEERTTKPVFRTITAYVPCVTVVTSQFHQLRPRGQGSCRTLLGMAVKVEVHNTGDLELQRDVVASVEHILSDRPGEWQVLIVGSQGSDRWEMKIFGPNAFERSYTLERSSGEHAPQRIAALVNRIVS
jgi:hypothetical protein